MPTDLITLDMTFSSQTHGQEDQSKLLIKQFSETEKQVRYKQ